MQEWGRVLKKKILWKKWSNARQRQLCKFRNWPLLICPLNHFIDKYTLLHTHTGAHMHSLSGVPSIFFTEKPLRQFASGLNYTKGLRVGSVRPKRTNEFTAVCQCLIRTNTHKHILKPFWWLQPFGLDYARIHFKPHIIHRIGLTGSHWTIHQVWCGCYFLLLSPQLVPFTTLLFQRMCQETNKHKTHLSM